METDKTNLRPYGINPEKGRAYENITYVLALVYNLLQARVEKYLLPHGLSAVQFNLLMLASYQNNGKGLNQVELSKRLIASSSNITKLVEKSVKEGLLVREENPKSRRENIIRITAKGQKLIDRVWPGYDRLVCELTNKIPAKKQPHMEQILQSWLLKLQEEK